MVRPHLSVLVTNDNKQEGNRMARNNSSSGLGMLCGLMLIVMAPLLCVFALITGCEPAPTTKSEYNTVIDMKANRLNKEAAEQRGQRAFEAQVKIRQYELEHK